MLLEMMHAKLHGARVTDNNLAYQGSITIDRDLLDRVGMLPHQKVQVANKSNGERFDTYVIEGRRGAGEIVVNGAAARLVSRGDELLIIAYGLFPPEEAATLRPKVAFLTPDNRVLELRGH
jgi:aspartate 1-decarboxylase